MRLAMKLMTKYAIEQAEIADATSDKRVRFEWSEVLIPADPVNGTSSTVGWIGSMAVDIAKFTDCKADWRRHPAYGYCIRYQGEIMDVEYAGYLTKHLRDTIRRQSAKFVGGRKEREDFRRGMVNRIGQRMTELKRAMKEELRATPAGNAGTALVIVDQKIALRDEQFGKFKTSKSYSRSAGAFAFGAGSAAGDKVGLGRPVGHETKRAIGSG
jgi:hypothetical protein